MADEISERIMPLTVRAGSTDISIQVPMVDITDGFTPETGLTVTDFDVVYSRVHVAAVKDDCVALATPAVDDPHLDYGCFEVDSTNMKGAYRFDLPDVIFAAGEENALVAIHHASCRSVYVNISLDSVLVGVKTGFVLASTGLDSIAVTEPAGVATDFREMVVQTWRRFFKKSTLTASQIKCIKDDGSSIATTQAVSDDGTTQTQGAAT